MTGYRKILRDGGYPYIVRDTDATVDGFLLRDVDAQALRIFDAYEDEGQLYLRTDAVATVSDLVNVVDGLLTSLVSGLGSAVGGAAPATGTAAGAMPMVGSVA